MTDDASSVIITLLTASELDRFKRKAQANGLTAPEYLSSQAARGVDLLDIQVYTSTSISLQKKADYARESTLTPVPVVLQDRKTYIKALGLAKELALTNSDVMRISLALAIP